MKKNQRKPINENVKDVVVYGHITKATYAELRKALKSWVPTEEGNPTNSAFVREAVLEKIEREKAK